jgi:RND family efflux transporter MFP subunit
LKITAPFDGVITERRVHPGALAGSGALLELEQNQRLRLVVAVPEAETAGIEPAARVAFTVPAYPGRTFTGVVARPARSLEPKTRTMPVELDVDNARGALSPGMYAEVAWPVRRQGASLLVPLSSIVTTTERMFVIRASNGRAEYVTVSRGAPAGDLVEVFGPLHAGDEILRRASDEIRSGTVLRGAAR